MPEPTYASYICLKKPQGERGTIALRASARFDVIEHWKDEKKSDSASDEKDNRSSSEASGSDGEIEKLEVHTGTARMAELMKKLNESFLGYRTLITFSSALIPIMREKYKRDDILNNIHRDFSVIEDNEEFITAGVKPEDHHILTKHVSMLKEFDQAKAAMPGSILLGLVATFDSYLADILRTLYRSRPERFEGSDQVISIKDLLRMNSFDDAISRVIEDQIENVMRKSHDEQIAFIENNFNVHIRKHYDKWTDFIELFERRNLVAHGDLQVNRQYVQVYKRAGGDISGIREGEKLKLDASYLRGAADLLLEFGVLLIFVLWRKQFAEEIEDAYENITDMTYKLIKEDKSRVASRILYSVVFQQKLECSDRIAKVMTVNLANALKKAGDEAEAEKALQSVNWSATAYDFQISIASIREDVEEVVRLMPIVNRSQILDKSHFREWPVFDWVRENPVFMQTFYDLYGENVIRVDPSGNDSREEVEDEDGAVVEQN